MNNTRIHPTALIDLSAIVGVGTTVWINVQIRENANVGKHCILSKDVYVGHSVSVDDKSKIQNLL